MADIVTIQLSKRATDVAGQLADTGKFGDALTAAKFALAYALKNYFDEFDPDTFNAPDSAGNSYNKGSVDSDGQLANILCAIYPETNAPYKYARALMNFGLMKIGERIDEDGMPAIYTLCK